MTDSCFSGPLRRSILIYVGELEDIEEYRPGGCPYPYLPRGFAFDGEDGFDDVDTTGDCSITYAEALGGDYETKCFMYLAINVVVFLVNLRWLQIFYQKR